MYSEAKFLRKLSASTPQPESTRRVPGIPHPTPLTIPTAHTRHLVTILCLESGAPAQTYLELG
jgi:hypothetical protein